MALILQIVTVFHQNVRNRTFVKNCNGNVATDWQTLALSHKVSEVTRVGRVPLYLFECSNSWWRIGIKQPHWKGSDCDHKASWLPCFLLWNQAQQVPVLLFHTVSEVFKKNMWWNCRALGKLCLQCLHPTVSLRTEQDGRSHWTTGDIDQCSRGMNTLRLIVAATSNHWTAPRKHARRWLLCFAAVRWHHQVSYRRVKYCYLLLILEIERIHFFDMTTKFWIFF